MKINLEQIDAYLEQLPERLKYVEAKHRTRTRESIAKKRRIVGFFLNNKKWPSYRGETERERSLGRAYENACSPESLSYDPAMRDLALAHGRKASGKRAHNVEGFKQQIIDFIKEHGHAPRRAAQAGSWEEANLHGKLSYYVWKKRDMTLLGKIYDLDLCHRSGIPVKFRPLINSTLIVEGPLVNMTKTELGT